MTTMRTGFLTVLLAIAHLSGIARADAGENTGAVLVTGSAPEKDKGTTATSVRTAAHAGGWELAEAPLSAAESRTVLDCLKSPRVWSCLDPIATSKKIGRWIIVRVEPDRSPDGTPALTVTEQVLVRGSDVPTTDRRYCANGCSDEQLTRIAFDLTKALIEEASAGTAKTTVTIRSVPSGAWITLDGNNVGLTDHTYATFPGRHVIGVQRAGYEAQTRTVEVAENRETTVAFELRSTSTNPEPSRVVPLVVAGAGAAMFAVGLGLQLSKDPPDMPPQPERLVSAPGIGLMVAGGVAIGVGTFLWVRATKHAKPSSGPAGTAVSGGAVLGWQGKF